ncbi:MAG: hypothetical protein B9S30_02860, partial [Verrucomicrobiia bacterium Tous-C5FEB]
MGGKLALKLRHLRQTLSVFATYGALNMTASITRVFSFTSASKFARGCRFAMLVACLAMPALGQVTNLWHIP